MYNYKLSNNHYVVDIDGEKYLIDTGSPISFWVSRPITSVKIDGNTFFLQGRPSNFDVKATNSLVGVPVDGFIGMDIISKTGLTIHKNGTIEFVAREIDGIEIPMTKRFPLVIDIECNSLTGKFIVDTGAKYGYGVGGLFKGQVSFNRVQDYNPSLGILNSEIYHLDIALGGEKKSIDVCDNGIVASSHLVMLSAIMIGNVSSLFEETCVLDTIKGKIVLK